MAPPARGILLAIMAGAAAAATPRFQDDFNSFDLSVWKHEITLGGGGNWEFEGYYNNRSVSYVRDGVLYIKPGLLSDRIGDANVKSGYTMDVWGSDPPSLCTGNAFYGCSRTSGAGGNYLNPIQSARVRTAESFSFKYGRMEVRAKLPKGDWLWPAIWLLPRHEQYGLWPASGEIDIMESRGNAADYPPGGCNKFGSTLHWGPYYPEDPFNKTHAEYQIPTGDLTTDFHVYGLLWNETHITTYIDNENQVVLQAKTVDLFKEGGWSGIDNPWVGGGANAPFDQEFYIILNVAVGGTTNYWPDGVGGKPWSNSDPHAVNSFYNNQAQWYSTWNGEDAALQIDSVIVY